MVGTGHLAWDRIAAQACFAPLPRQSVAHSGWFLSRKMTPSLTSRGWGAYMLMRASPAARRAGWRSESSSKISRRVRCCVWVKPSTAAATQGADRTCIGRARTTSTGGEIAAIAPALRRGRRSGTVLLAGSGPRGVGCIAGETQPEWGKRMATPDAKRKDLEDRILLRAIEAGLIEAAEVDAARPASRAAGENDGSPSRHLGKYELGGRWRRRRASIRPERR